MKYKYGDTVISLEDAISDKSEIGKCPRIVRFVDTCENEFTVHGERCVWPVIRFAKNRKKLPDYGHDRWYIWFDDLEKIYFAFLEYCIGHTYIVPLETKDKVFEFIDHLMK